MSVLSQEYVKVELLRSLGANNMGCSMNAAIDAILRARHILYHRLLEILDVAFVILCDLSKIRLKLQRLDVS